MIGYPKLLAVRPHRQADRVDADIDASDNRPGISIDHIYGVGRRVRDKHMIATRHDRCRVWAQEGRVADLR